MGLFEFFTRNRSGNVAKDRLKLLLVSDRANCSPEIMEAIKNDIIKVISRYMDVTRRLWTSRSPRPLRGRKRSRTGPFRKYPY